MLSFLPPGAYMNRFRKLPGPLADLSAVTQCTHVRLVLRGIGHVHDETSVAAVVVVLATEQGGGFVEQRALQSRQPLWKAVNLLIDVRLTLVINRPAVEFVLIAPSAHLVVGFEVFAASHVFAQSVLQAEHAAQHVLALLEVVTAMQR